MTSSVVTVQRESLFDQEIRLLAFEISKIAFQQKRKKIRTSLTSFINEDHLLKINIDPNLRIFEEDLQVARKITNTFKVTLFCITDHFSQQFLKRHNKYK